MPNGKCFRPYRIPGSYQCITCRDLKDAEEFYKDSSRFNGCSSRCKDCERLWSKERTTGQRFIESERGFHTTRSQTDNRWSRRQIKKRVEEIKSD